MISVFELLFSVGIINTIRINSYYFGIGGIIKPSIILSRNVKIRDLKGSVKIKNKGLGVVRIGFGNVGIIDNKYMRSIWDNKGEILFQGRAHFGPGTRITNSGVLLFGDNTMINGNVNLVCRKNIEFGKNVLISWECLVMDSDFHRIMDDSSKCINPDESIIINDNVWIGCRSTVLKGSNIPKGAIIGATSLISTDLGECNTIYRNNLPIKNNVTWTM